MEEAKEQENRKFMTTEKPLDDKPYVGNLHTAVSQRFGDVDWLDDGNDILATPMCGSLLYKCAKLMLGTLVAIAVAASAMPTPEQTMEAERVVRELLREDQAALKRGRKTRAEVADSAMSLAGQTESDAAKFLLMKGAYNLYVRAGEFDKAVTTLRGLQAAIPDIPPDRMVSIIEAPLLGVPRRSGGRLRRILDEAKLLARYAREVPELERSLRKTPDDQALRRSLAEHHACLGRWDLALENFSAVEGRAGEIAKAERDGSVDAAAAADFWWRYPSGKEELERYFRAHAATLYEKAIASGALSGLDKVLAERRIAEAKAGDLSAEPATAKRPEVTAGNAPRTASASAAGRLYCVVDLSAGPNATRYPVSYLSAAPRGGWPDVYKTMKLVLRRIEPGTFIMGEDQKDESHRVTLTKPFYIGVFEVTQKQYALVTWAAPSAFKGDMRPVENVSYEMIRGKDEGAKWPSSSAVDTYSFLGKLRMKTGLDFDLPTEAQWEYACRAGTKSKYNNGGDAEGDLKRLGRFTLNQKSRGWRESNADFARHRPDGNGGHLNHHTVVGSYLPNAWGLYDMHGNVWEWCLDWYGGLVYGKDPMSSSSGSNRVKRGCSWDSSAGGGTSPRRSSDRPSWKFHGNGFRLCCAAELATVKSVEEAVAESVTVIKLYKAKACGVSSYEPIGGLVAANAFDGDPRTYWHTQWKTAAPGYPHFITGDIGKAVEMKGVILVPRQDLGNGIRRSYGLVRRYRIELSPDGANWRMAKEGELSNSHESTEVKFDSPQRGRYIRFTALSPQDKSLPYASMAEIQPF